MSFDRSIRHCRQCGQPVEKRLPDDGDTRLRDICTQLVIADGKKADVAGRRCGCYSKGVLKAMTPGERDEMRVTGKFSPSAQPKAKKFMASCRVSG